MSDIVKAKSSGEDPRATGGLVSNIPHPRVNKTKQHTPCWNCTTSYKFSVSVKKMEGWTGGASEIVKAKSSGEDPRATGGLVSNLSHPRVNKTKQHTRWERLWNQNHEQHFAFSPRVSRLITFPPTSWLLLPWQASLPGTVSSDAAHPVISTPHRLRTSEIPLPKSVSSAVTHRCHHRPALPFRVRDWHPFTKPVLTLVEKFS